MDRRLDAVDWTLAESRLIRLIALYAQFMDKTEQKTQAEKLILKTWVPTQEALLSLYSLRKRYNDGERTQKLFDAMINCE